MTLRLCIDCATIFDCPPDVAKICPRCDGPLELREQVKEDVPAWVKLAIRAVHGEVPRLRPRWSIE